MNKVFKVIWNHATQTWVAVSELTQAKGKTKSSSTAKAAAAAVAIAASSVAGVASAAVTSQPAGSNAGNVYVSTSENQTLLGQSITVGKDGTQDNISTSHATTIAIGTNLQADGYGSVVIGDGARTERQMSPDGTILASPETDTKNGGSANALTATNGRSVSIGFNTLARAQSVAIGVNSQALLNETVAIGVDAKAAYRGAVAIGHGAEALEVNTAAFGANAKATHQNAYALGPEAQALAPETTAIGAGVLAKGTESLAIGIASNALEKLSVAIGRARAESDQSIAFGYFAKVDTASSGGMAIGRSAHAKGPHTIAIGSFAQTDGKVALAIGQQAHAKNHFATAVGIRAYANAERSGAFGAWSQVTGASNDSFAVGTKNKITDVANTYVLGGYVTPTQANSVILGNKSADRAETVENAATVNGISYEGFAGNKKEDGNLRAVSDNAGIVSVGKPNAERQIINVAPGKISEDSTDAINGSQLYLTQHALGNVAKTAAQHLGGRSTVNPDGNLTAPTYELVVGNPQAGTNANLPGQANTRPATNVGDALGNLNAYVNKGFDIRENGTDAASNTKATVTPGEAVNFVNGKGTTAKVANETAKGVTDVTFDVDFGNLSNNNLGKATTTDPAATPKVASTADVVNAINNSGFNLKVDKAAGSKNSKATDGGAKLVKPGEEVVFKAGDNIELTRAGKEITIASKPSFKIATDADGSKNINANDTIKFAPSDDGLANFSLDTGSGTIKPKLTTLAQAPVINNNNNPKQGAIRTQDEGANKGIADHLVTGARLAEAINNSYWRANIDQIGTGEGEAADADAQIKAGDKVEFIAGNGMKIEIDESNRQFTFSLKTDDIPAPETATLTVNTTPDGQGGNVNEVPDDDKGKLATAGDVANAINQSGWNLAGKGADGTTDVATTVNPSDKVSFTNSDTADVVINADDKANPTVTVNVKTADVAADDTPANKGKVKVTVPQGGTEDAENKKLATAKTVADAINASGFTASIARDDADFADQDGDAEELINPGDKLVFQSGKNLKVKQEQEGETTKFTYATLDDVNFSTVTINTKIKDPNQPDAPALEGSPITMLSLPSTPDADNTNTLTFLGQDPQDKSKVAPVKIVNIESGLKPYNAPGAPELPAPFKAAEGLVNLNTPNIDDSNVVTAGDLRKMGWVVEASNTPNGFEKAVKNAQKVDIRGTGGVKVIGSVQPDGHYRLDVSLEESSQLVQEFKDGLKPGETPKPQPTGRVTIPTGDPGAGFVSANDVAHAINNSGFIANIGRNDDYFTDQTGKGTDDQNPDDRDLVIPGDKVNYLSGKNLKVKREFSKDGQDGIHNFTFATEENVEFSTVKVATKVRDPNTGNVLAEGAPITLASAPVDPNNPDATKNTLVFGATDKGQPAPVTLANIKSNLPDAYNKGDKVIGENGYPTADDAPKADKVIPGPTANQAADMHNKAATVGDVLNAGFNLQGNGEAVDFVKAYDTLNFADGTGTTVEVKADEDGKVSTIKVNTVMAYTDENGNKVAKADDGNYYPVDPATGEPDKTKPAVENPQVNVVNADGTTTKPTVLGNVAAGAKTYGPNLAQPTNETEEAKNIAKNVSDAYEGLADLNSSTPTNVMTVADAKNMGWVVSTLHGNGYADDVRNANHVDFVGTGLATVKGHTDEATGIRVITVDVNAQNVVQDAQLPVVYTNKDGDKVVKVGDKFYKQDDIIAVDGKVYPKDSVVAADGQVYPEGTTLNDQGLPTDSNVAAIQPLPEDSDKVVDPATIIASMNNGNNETKTPMPLANVGGNLPNSYNKGDKTVVDADGREAIGGKPTGDARAKADKQGSLDGVDVEKVFNNAATVGDVLNTGWNLQGNGEAVDFVKPYDTVNFADGTGTTVEVTADEDGKVSTIKVNTLTAYTDDKGNKVAKADDGKFYPIDPATGKPDTEQDPVSNPQVNLVNTDGSTNKPIVLGNVAQGAEVFGPDMFGPIGTTPEAIEAAANISNAYEGLANLAGSNDTNVMTVADAKNMGWVVSTINGNGYADDVRNANQVEFVGTGLATVKGHTDPTTFARVITVDVNAQNVVQDAQLPVVYTNKDGDKVIKVGDKFFKEGDVDVIDGKAYPKGSVLAADGQVYPAGTELTSTNLPLSGAAEPIQPIESGDQVVNPADIIASMNNGDNDTKVPMQLANVLGTLKQVTPEGQVNNPNGEKAADAAPANLKKAPNTAEEIEAFHNDPNVMKRAATVGDVLNTGFNLQANGEDADFVRHGDTVNFADGTGTTVEFVPSEDGKTNTIKINTVMAYTDENGNKVAKADDGKYYPVDPETGKPNKDLPAVENPQVNVVNADGSTTKPTVLGNVAAGAKTYGPNLAQPTNNTPEAIEMAKNVSDAYEGLADLNSSNPTNVLTVADAKNMGWVVSTLHGNGYADDVRNANHVDFVGTGLATVKGHTDATTGIRVITVDVNAQNVVQDAQLPVVYTNKDGDKVVKVGDKFYKQDDITVVDGKVYPKDSVVAADGQVYPEGTTLNDQGLPTDNNVAAIQPLPENSDKVVAPADIIASMNNGDNSTAEPMTLANVMGTLKQVTPEGQVNNPNGEKAADAAPENLKKAPNTAEEIEGFHKDPDVLNRAATVGDVLNTGFNLQGNGEDADFVRHGDTVNFVNGKGTVASVETNPEGTATNVTFNIDAGEINATDKGDVTGPVKAAEEALKAAQDALAQDPDNQDLKDAVKKAEGDLAKAGDQVATAQNVADAINNSGWNIVGKGEPDEDGNRKDVTTKVKPGSQVSFQDGKGTKAITDVDSEGNPFVRIDIDADKVAENISKGDINVVNEGDNAGTVAPKAGDENKLVTAQEVADAINGSGWTAAIGRDNTDFADQAGADQPQLINPGETVKFQSGKNLKVKQDGNNITYALADDVEINTAQVGGPGKDGQPGKDGSVNVKAADGQSGVAINGKDASVTAGGDNGASVAINGKDGSIGLQGPRGDNGKDGLGATIKVGQGPAGIHGDDGFAGLNGEKPRLVYTPIDPATGRPALDKDGKPVEEKVATLNDGLAFAGDDPAVKVKRKLGETLNIKGGANKDRLTDNNIGVVADPATGALNVKLAKDVNLGDDGSLAVGGVTINQDGINAGGKQIKNVAPGTAPTDAVNVSQLRDATIDVHNKINRNNKDLRAGIAGANAAAGLPQVYIPGKSMVAASAGTFKGQSAVAVGYSRASDNGKLILKLQGNANTRGDFGGSVGVGYQW